ncbi:hypothetical protein G7Y89_g8146 [Cudoniella acicularis]|uniref:2EXR domain-containing protein n=1 Tax=Cudoniella acicularis TaxID=354080 RepID=A0A8H4W1B9_9HELO|nr:hypothetical protein G7Y89_g8146 [Cudoniella acicularis]
MGGHASSSLSAKPERGNIQSQESNLTPVLNQGENGNENAEVPSTAEEFENQNQPIALSPSSLPTFTLFSKLPTELRIKIWKFVASVGRIVPTQIQENSYGDKPVPFLRQEYFYRVFSPQPYLAMRYACAEATEVALKSSTPLFKPYKEVPNRAFSFISANLSIDTVAFPEHISTIHLKSIALRMTKESRDLVTCIIRESTIGKLDRWRYFSKFSYCNTPKEGFENFGGPFQSLRG